MKYQHDPRKKRRGPTIETGGVQANVARIMDKVAAGEKVVPLQKGEGRPVNTKPKVRFKFQHGICSGCHRPLLRNVDGRTFHNAGVITKTETCTYAVLDYKEEVDTYNHTVKLVVGGRAITSRSLFMWDPTPPDPALYEHTVPEWAFFSDDGEFV